LTICTLQIERSRHLSFHSITIEHGNDKICMASTCIRSSSVSFPRYISTPSVMPKKMIDTQRFGILIPLAREHTHNPQELQRFTPVWAQNDPAYLTAFTVWAFLKSISPSWSFLLLFVMHQVVLSWRLRLHRLRGNSFFVS
jgi:hypothetical protein